MGTKTRHAVAPVFPERREGDRPSASEWNRLVAQVQQLSRIVGVEPMAAPGEIFRLDEAFNFDNIDAPEDARHTATKMFWSDDQVQAMTGRYQSTKIVDPTRSVWDLDDTASAIYHRQSGSYLLQNPRRIYCGMTYPDSNGSYPSPGANKFPFKFVRVEYDRSAGMEAPRIVFLDSQDTTAGGNRDDYVLNLYDDYSGFSDGPVSLVDDITITGSSLAFTRRTVTDYIQPYTLIPVWTNLGKNTAPDAESESSGGIEQEPRWYTYHLGFLEEDGSSEEITGGSGNGAELIRFKILSVDTATDVWSAEVDITARPCGVSTVSEEVGGIVTVYDPCHVFLDEPEADLVGRCGGAAYMDPEPDSPTGTGTALGTGTSPCQWEIQWLACPAC